MLPPWKGRLPACAREQGWFLDPPTETPPWGSGPPTMAEARAVGVMGGQVVWLRWELAGSFAPQLLFSSPCPLLAEVPPCSTAALVKLGPKCRAARLPPAPSPWPWRCRSSPRAGSGLVFAADLQAVLWGGPRLEPRAVPGSRPCRWDSLSAAATLSVVLAAPTGGR